MRRLLTFLLLPLAAMADLRPLYLDGFSDDWAGNPDNLTDPAGDSSGPDLLELAIANDPHFVILKFRLAEDLLQQSDNSLVLYLDTDGDSQTGFQAEGLGCELVWNFADRGGTVYRNGQSQAVLFSQLDLRILPTHASTEFELALGRAAEPLGAPLFESASVQAVLKFNQTGGDRLPDTGSALLPIAAGTVADPPLLPLARDRAEDLRLLSWNTLFGSLFTPATQDEYQRILRALDADVIAFQEIWDQSAEETAATLDQLDPRDTPWQAAKLTSGNVLASRFPIIASWLVHGSYRNTAHLLQTGDALGTPLLVINIHLRCCSADAQRQVEADAITAFIRNAQQGAYAQIPGDTPIVLCGDFNLVGLHQQLLTLLDGDIQDETQFGADNPPDWDGSSLTDLCSYQLGNREAWSWQDDGDYSPGRLDFVLYTDSVLDTGRHGLLWTPGLPADTLAAWGLQAGDVPGASDHLPRFVDLRPVGVSSVGDAGTPALPGDLRLDAPYPNPFNPTTQVRWNQRHAGAIDLEAFSIQGRHVAQLARGWYPAGEHSLGFDGTHLASGVYLLSLRQENLRAVTRMLLLK
jgi:endonuclease/exonuclease/phosphatase family metal-dependent hydrolase